MTLELVDESDVRKAGNKEKKLELKPGLRLVDESEIKKVGSEKKSWLDIVDESEIREDSDSDSDSKIPKIEVVSGSDTRKVGGEVKKPGLEFVARGRIVNCERQIAGMTNNCVLCKELSRDRFDRCPNKYGGF